MTSHIERTRTGPQGGPPLLAPGIAYGVLAVTATVLLAKIPQPGASAAAILGYDQAHQTVLRVAGFFIFAASAPLAIWTATAYRRLRTLGVTAPGAVIGLSGGLLAAASLALSGLLTWTSGQLGDANTPAVARAMNALAFAAGSAGFVVPLGLLVAGIAVPTLILRFTARWLAWAGLVIAVVSLLSTFILLTPALDATLPIGRFAGLAWLITISVVLPRNRHAVSAASGRTKAETGGTKAEPGGTKKPASGPTQATA